ncbi:MAG TPA: hypothetical protein VE954_22920 [Oligoflexus sp.]|uniref:hypothetical protein n=1 Tax=Oligoflexus sp. TaxID=1971216 RepID=UPI002D56175A|nr:hypothetical protein [Oligoflexus sp.]HYX35964.1 hypothetical protein [Oligoflexus sp.]
MMRGTRRLVLLLTVLGWSPVTLRGAARETITSHADQVQSVLRSLQKTDRPHVDLSLQLKQTTASGLTLLTQHQKVKQVKLKPVDTRVWVIQGETFVMPKAEGQRSCADIRQDWHQLDRVYAEVNGLAVELEEVYSQADFCAPCAQTVLQTLKEATLDLESISSRLHQDGDRLITVIWGPQAFIEDRQEIYTGLTWDQLVYYNIDGDSQVADSQQGLPWPPGLIIRQPLLRNGIQFQLTTSAERACSPGFEVRLDGTGLATVAPQRMISWPDKGDGRLRTAPVSLILLTSHR